MDDFESRFAAAVHGSVTSDLLTHLAHQAARVIPCHPASSAATAAATTVAPAFASAFAPLSDSQYQLQQQQQQQVWPPPLRTFISVVVKRSAVRAGTLFAVLVFLGRLQRRLERVARGMPCTCHRIFLATLIVTSKALHDASPKNKNWAKYAMYCFNVAEINLMEKQLLSILNYRLGISLRDLHLVFGGYDSFLLMTPPLTTSSSLSFTSSSTLSSTSSMEPDDPTLSITTANTSGNAGFIHHVYPVLKPERSYSFFNSSTLANRRHSG